MTVKPGDRVFHQGLDCKVLAVTYREGGLCKLERPDGSVLDDVKLSPRVPEAARPKLVSKGEW